MNKFEAKLALSSLLKRNPVIYIEYEIQENKYSCGRYYTFNKVTNLYHITFDIACVLDMYDDFFLVPAFNWRTKRAEKCIKTRHPETLVRDLSQELFLRWNAIKFYSLKGERSS